MGPLGILTEAGAAENADLRPDDIATVTAGSRRLVFGPATTEGLAADGWDATTYELQDDPDGEGEWWKETGYVYAETDEEMIALAAQYAG